MMTLSPGPGEASPSFAQTGAELNLDSDSDLDLHAAEMGPGESYELKEVNKAGGVRGSGSSSSSGGNEWTPEDDNSPRGARFDDLDMQGERVLRRRRRTSTAASFELYTPDEEEAVVRKFDRKLVVFVALLFMLSFLDRSNIGNALISGMDEDLQSDPPKENWYEWSLTAFYISYISFEWMSLLWKVIPAHIFVSAIVLSWGITASLQSIATSYPMLIFLRVVLGIGEAGFTGIPFYLSFFFKRKELAFRTAIFISAAPLATSFASSLAWLIVKLGDYSPISSWRLLFLVEGFPSVIAATIAWSVIPDSPQTAPYLTPREKRIARLRLRKEKSFSSKSTGLKGRDVLASLVDPISWVTAAMFFLTNMAYSSLPVFLPKILEEMGHSALSAQAMSAPPYLVAFGMVLLTAKLSDVRQSRSIFIVVQALQSAFGYAALAFAEPMDLPPVLRYIAVYFACVGFFNVVALTVTWSINNQASESRQGGGFALLQLVGQCGPLVGVQLYPDREAPFYTRGMQACGWAMFAVAILALLLRFYMKRLNDKMDREAAETGGAIGEEEGLVGTGVRIRSPKESFRYIL